MVEEVVEEIQMQMVNQEVLVVVETIILQQEMETLHQLVQHKELMEDQLVYRLVVGEVVL